MNMDLVIVFAFVSTVTLIVTAGIVMFPIARKLGFFLEQAARERAERLAAGKTEALPESAAGQLLEAITGLQDQVEQLTERQAFTERLLEKRPDEE